jgi:sec-independent protein translocase protein TatC
MADADALRDAATSGVPVPPTSPPAPPAVPDGAVMSLVDHLSELRTRVFRSILAVVAGSAVGFYVAKPVRDFLLEPLPGGQAQVLGPGDAFAIQLRISIVIGIILAMPVLLYQIWAFIAPGLTPSERRTIRPWIPLALLFFALGVGIARFVLPFAVTFLLSFTDEKLVANMAAQPYFDFVTTLFLAFGLLLEFPILLFGLSRVGILSSQRLSAARRYVILIIAVVSAVATPGTDLVSPLALGLTMYVLFELTLQVIKRTGR